MSLFLPVKRATVLIPSGPVQDQGRMHLFILLTNPCAAKKTLLVSVTTHYPSRPHDPTCILDDGDHPFIRHKSWVFYAKSRVEEAAKLFNGVKQGLFAPKPSLDEPVFLRVSAGVLTSPFTPPAIKSYYTVNRHL